VTSSSSNEVHPSVSPSIIELATVQWFSPGTPVSSTNKTDSHDITEILLKVASNTITLTVTLNIAIRNRVFNKMFIIHI
jgi:hypothetical protein